MKERIGKKGFSLIFNSLAVWIIVLIVFALLLGLALILFGKGQGAIEFLKNIFSLRR